MSVSPTSTAFAPALRTRCASVVDFIPDSLTRMTSSGTSSTSFSVIPRSVVKVLRFLLLIPMRSAPMSRAVSISGRLWTSSRTSIWKSLAML